MDTVSKAVLIVHTLIALGIIALVLLQRGKGADAGAGFGAGASGTVFGARGSGSFFSRATAILATAFFISSLTLAYLSSQTAGEQESLLEGAPAATEDTEQMQMPAAGDEMPTADMPSLEDQQGSSEDAGLDEGMPVLENQESPAPQEGQ